MILGSGTPRDEQFNTTVLAYLTDTLLGGVLMKLGGSKTKKLSIDYNNYEVHLVQ